MSTGVQKTSALFGSPSGESPTNSNPFAFVTQNKPPQPLEMSHQHMATSPGVGNNTQSVPSTTGGLDHLYSSQPFGITQQASGVTPQQDGLGYSIHGSSTKPPSMFGASMQAGSGPDFFDTIPQVVPLQTQVSNPLQHQSLQGGGNLVNRTSPFVSMGMGQPPAVTESEHLRHNSLPSMSYPDFYSGIQQPSLPAVTQEEHMPDGSRTSASAPSTGVHPLQPMTQGLASEHQLTSLPASLQPSQQQPNVEDPIPRPPSNADVPYASNQFGTNFNNTQVPSYPASNTNAPDPDNSGGVSDEPTLTNATNATQKLPLATPELNTNLYSTTLNQPELMPTHYTGFEREEVEDPLSNVRPHGAAHDTSTLNDSMGSQSMSSLLQGSQEEFTGSSPVRLLPPAPVTGPQSLTSPISLSSPMTQESLGSGLSLIPPAPLEQVLHPPVVSHNSSESPVSVYEPHTNALPQLTNATNKQPVSEDSDWEIVDNEHVPPHAMVSNLYSQPPVTAHQTTAMDTAQQTTAQFSSLTLNEKTQPPPQQQLMQGDIKQVPASNLATVGVSVSSSNIVLGGPPPMQNVATYSPALQTTQSPSQPIAMNLQLQAQPLPSSQVASPEPVTSDERRDSHQSSNVNSHQVEEEPSNLVSSNPVAHPTYTNVTGSNLYVHSTPVVSTAPSIPPTTPQGFAGHSSQFPSSFAPNIQSLQAQVSQQTTTGVSNTPAFPPPSATVHQPGPPITSAPINNTVPNPEPPSQPPPVPSNISTPMPLSVTTATTEQPTSIPAQTTPSSVVQTRVSEPPATVSTQQPLASGAPPVTTSQSHERQDSRTSASNYPSTMDPSQRRDSDYHDGRPQYDADRYRQPPDHYNDRRDPYYEQRGGGGDGGYYRDGERDYYGGDRPSHPSTYSERGPDQYGHEYRPTRGPSHHPYNYPHYPPHDYRDPYHHSYHHPGYRGEYDNPYHQRGGGGYRGYGAAPYPPVHHQDGYGHAHSQYYGEHYSQGQYGYADRYGSGQYPTAEDHQYRGHYDSSHQHGGQYGDEYSSDPRYEYDSRYHQPTPYGEQPPSSVSQPNETAGYDTQYTQQQAYQDTQYGEQQQQQQEGGYQTEDFNPAEASVIYGGQNHFEISQSFIDSPNTRRTLPQHPQHHQHESTAYLEGTYSDEYLYQQEGYGAHHHQQQHGQYDYTDGQYQQDGQYYTQEGYGEEQQQPGVVETTPPPPPRDTPELFAHPHVRASFGFGGQLITVLPNRQSTIVEVCSIKNVVSDVDTSAFVEAVDVAQGPFIVGDTPKSHVLQFASQQAQKCREKMTVEPDNPTDRERKTNLEDEALMWDFLVLLCQQNGVVLPSDVADLLMNDRPLSISSNTHFGTSAQEESLQSLRQLLLAGRKKDALDLACSKSLWGHALMLASRMDEQSRTYVVNRFTASLMTTDPLSTFYTLLLGRSPSVVKPEGLARAGDWRPHLAMILANRTSKLDNDSIVSLGDSLLSQGRLNAAHLCYYLSNVHFGSYGNTETKYSLLGVNHSCMKVGTYPQPCDLQKMEVFEYAMSLNKQEFTLPYFQTFKYLHVLKLVEAGFVGKALKYCEQISQYVVKGSHSYVPTFLQSLSDLSVKLHHQNSPFGVVENELPSWLILLQQSVGEALSNDYNPSVLSPSPAFSSVSQTYAGQPTSQPIIGLQLQGPFLSVPATGGSSLKSSAVSSKEGSVVAMPTETNAMKVNPILGVHQLELYTNTPQGTEQQQEQPNLNHLQQQQQQQMYGYQGQEVVQTVGSVTQYEQVDGADQIQSSSDPMFSGHQPVAPSTQQDGVTNVNQQPAQTDFYSQYAQPPSSMQNSDNTQALSTGIFNQQTNYMYTPDFGLAGNQPQPSAPDNTQQLEQQQQQGQTIQGQSSQPVVPPLYDPTTTDPTHTAVSQTAGSSGNVNPYDYWQNLNPPSEEEMRQRQQEREASVPTSTVDRSGDSHMEQKGEEGKEDGKEKEESSKGKDKKEEKKSQQSSGGGGWGFGLLKYIIPKQKNQAHLPEDKNPRIIWDKEKNKWIDLDANEEEQSGPAPPPTDFQLTKSQPLLSSAPQPGGPPIPGGSGGDSTDGTATQDVSTIPPPANNMYSRQGSKRGRVGARSKYVDVLNPGGTSSSSNSQPPPPGPPPMAAMMSGAGAMPFTGTFFVPQQAPENEQSSEAGATPTPTLTVDDNTKSDPGTRQMQAGPLTSEGNPQLDHHHHKQAGNPQNQLTQQDGSQQMFSILQQQQQQQQHLHPDQETVQTSLVENTQQQPVQTTQEQRGGSETSLSQQQPTLQPQFFNPSAFAPVNAFPSMVGTGLSEPQDDSLSTVSLMSESSQEVSRYMTKQHTATRSTSAGYSRLQQGIRGVRGYPTKQVGGAQRPSGHTHQGVPPIRSTFQQRQQWQ